MKTFKYLAFTLISFLLINCSNGDLEQQSLDQIDIDNQTAATYLYEFPGTSEEDVIISIDRCVDRNGLICDNPCDCRELSQTCEELCDLIQFEPVQFYTKKFKGRICDEEWSCMPKPTYMEYFKIDIKAALPKKLDAVIVNKYGEVFAKMHLLGTDKKSGISRVGFEMVNEEAGKGKLTLELVNTVFNQEEQIIEEKVVFDLKDEMFMN